MKHKRSARVTLGLTVFFAATLTNCRSNPNKAEKIDTAMELSDKVSGGEKVGVQKGEMVVQDKMVMSERLRDLQNQVFALEDKAYGMRKLGSLGLYGQLKECRRKLASKAYGGTGTLVWTEPLDRVTDKEDEIKIGLDEKKDLVGVNREYLLDRLHRFSGYKQILQKRADEFQDRVEECRAEIANREYDKAASTRVAVQEAPKTSVDRTAIHAFVCGYVRAGASLQTLLFNAFAKGWLALGDLKMEQNLLTPEVKDAKDLSRTNVLLFNGWKLAYDHGPVALKDVLSGDPAKDARLQFWSFERKADVANAGQCLPNAEGAWNP